MQWSVQWPVQWPVQRLVQTAHLDGPVGSGLRLHLAQRDVGVGGRLQRGRMDGWTGGRVEAMAGWTDAVHACVHSYMQHDMYMHMTCHVHAHVHAHAHVSRVACTSRRHKVCYTSRESVYLGTFTLHIIRESLHLGCTTHLVVMTRSGLRLVTLQVSKADGWHGARRMARAEKQQTQPKQKQQKQKQQKQTQPKQHKQKQPTDGSQTRVPFFTSDPAGAVGVEARIPAIAHTASKSRNVLAISPRHAPYLLFVGRTGDRVS